MTHPYASETYARALADVGEAILLASAGTWALKVPIGATGLFDAMGCYPRCAIDPEADLAPDFARLQSDGIVSLTLVTDIFVRPEPSRLRAMFDLVRPYKIHYVHEPELPYRLDRHHRYEVKQAMRVCDVRAVAYREYLGEWLALYRHLVARHRIAGIQNFTDRYFADLGKLENLLAIAAFVDGRPVAMHLWLEHENVLYSHLAASNPAGYRAGAAYAIHDHVLRVYGPERRIDLGGSAGVEENVEDGLARFKKGFANETAPCFLCGQVLDRAKYLELAGNAGVTAAEDYFPGYRSPSRKPA